MDSTPNRQKRYSSYVTITKTKLPQIQSPAKYNNADCSIFTPRPPHRSESQSSVEVFPPISRLNTRSKRLEYNFVSTNNNALSGREDLQPETAARSNLSSTLQPETPGLSRLPSVLQSETPALSRPSSGSQPETPALPRPSSGSQPETPALSRPSSSSQLETPALPRPSSGSQPETPFLSRPSSGSQPETPALSRSSSGSQPETPALSRPSSGSQPETPALSRPSSGLKPKTAALPRLSSGLQPETPALSRLSSGRQLETPAIFRLKSGFQLETPARSRRPSSLQPETPTRSRLPSWAGVSKNISIDEALVQESSKAIERITFKKRSTMTLLSPSLSDIEDALSRIGPYEGSYPVVTPETIADDTDTGITKTSLRGMMAIIDHVSIEQTGFDPSQLVRTDPTVAKTVVDVLRDHTNEEYESLRKITLALCDDTLTNSEVLRVFEETVTERSPDNAAVYFAMGFFISRTQDPTKVQSSNSALSEEPSPSTSRTFMRAGKSVTFLLNALNSYMVLSQRAASLQGSATPSLTEFFQQRPSFLDAVSFMPRMSHTERSRRESLAQGFDFNTPSGWFFEEVEVDEDIVHSIRHSIQVMKSVMGSEMAISFPENLEAFLDEHQNAEDDTQTEQSTAEVVKRMTEVVKSVSPEPSVQQERSTPKVKVHTPKRSFKTKHSKKRFSGWDMSSPLPQHRMSRLPKETDMILPMLERMARYEYRRDDEEDTYWKPPRLEHTDQEGHAQQERPTGNVEARQSSLKNIFLDLESIFADTDLQDVRKTESAETKLTRPTAQVPRRTDVPLVPPKRVPHWEREESVDAYLSRHQVLELFRDLITKLVLTMPSDPMGMLIDRVRQLNQMRRIKTHVPQVPEP